MFWQNLLPPSSEQTDIASLSLISTSNCVSILHLSSFKELVRFIFMEVEVVFVSLPLQLDQSTVRHTFI